MAEITDSESLKAWLEARPEATRRYDATLIAARSALRSIPSLFHTWTGNADEQREKTLATSLRACASSHYAATWPNLTNTLVAGAIMRSAIASRTVPILQDLRADAVAEASSHAAYAVTTDGPSESRAARVADLTAKASDDRVEVFSVISKDLVLLDAGYTHTYVAKVPLWPSHRTPVWFNEDWHKLSRFLLRQKAAHENWHVWTNWYQARLDGDWIKPHSMDLERAIALIDEDIWQAGPATANAEIARLIAEHTPTANSSSQSDDQPAAQIAATEPYALLNFEYDANDGQMVRAPFPQDPPAPDDPYRLRDYSGLLAALKNRATELASDLREDQPQVPKALGRDLRRYARYAGVDHAELEPRDLIALGEALASALADEDIRMGLGNYLLSKLDRFVRDHQTFAAAFYAALVDRAAMVKKTDLLEHTSLEVLEATLADAKISIETTEAEEPPAPEDYLELLEQQAIDLREGRLKLDLKTQAAFKAEGAHRLSGPYVEALATAARFMAQRVQAISEHGLIVGGARVGGVLSLVEKILGILRIGG